MRCSMFIFQEWIKNIEHCRRSNLAIDERKQRKSNKYQKNDKGESLPTDKKYHQLVLSVKHLSQ